MLSCAAVRGIVRGCAMIVGFCAISYFNSASQAQCLVQRIVPPEDATGQMGWAIDYSQGRVIIGDSRDDTLAEDSGAAFVYRLIEGHWQLEGKLVPPTANDFQRFGGAVAISGTYAVMGVQSSGGAHVYELIDGLWTHVAHLTSSLDSRLGRSVAIFGTTILAGSPNELTENGLGRVYIFERINGKWQFQTSIDRPPPDVPQVLELFANELHFDGQHAIVKDHLQAHIFARKGLSWTLEDTLATGNFVTCVRVDDNFAAVGYGNDDSFGTDTGLVTVFERVGPSWVQHATIVPPSPITDGEFGFELDLRNDILTVCSRVLHNGELRFAIDRYLRNGQGWDHVGSTVIDGLFDTGVDRSVSLLPVGMIACDPEALPNGVAYFYSDRTRLWQETNVLTRPKQQADDHFGYIVDVSGDTLIAASPTFSDSINESAVVVLREEEVGYQHEQTITAPPDWVNPVMFANAAIDGNRLAIPIWGTNPANPQAQKHIVVYTRNGDTWSFDGSGAAFPLPDDSTFGSEVAWAGDHLLVGDANDDDGENDSGAIHIFENVKEGWVSFGKVKSPTPSSNQSFGTNFAVGGDVLVVAVNNPDGIEVFERVSNVWNYKQTILLADSAFSFARPIVVLDDMIIAGSAVDARAYVLKRQGSNGPWVFFQTLLDPQYVDSYFGHAVDVDGPFMVIGAPNDDTLCPEEIGSIGASCYGGAAHIYELRQGAWQYVTRLEPAEDEIDRYFGRSVAMSGTKAIVSAPYADEPAEDSGAVYIFDLLEYCPGDIDGDGSITELDRAALCGLMGSQAGDGVFHPAFDFNEDDVINHLDVIHFDALASAPGFCTFDLAHAATFQLPGDGLIDAADLAILLGAWGTAPSCADVASSSSFTPIPDGEVNAADLALLLSAWGPCE